MAPSKIVLSQRDAEDFARLTLSEIATRTPSKHQKAPFVSAHMARQTDPKYLRGSDLSERLCVSCEALMRAGYVQKEALAFVTEIAKKFQGRSRRGRPRSGTTKRDFMATMQSVRSMVNAFARRNQHLDDIVDRWIGKFLWERAIGAIQGSKYDPDFGRKFETRAGNGSGACEHSR